jgi:hypothetical protein
MSTQQMRGIIAVLMLVVVISSTALTAVEASRRLPEEGYAAGHATLHERARSLVVSWWMAQKAGPSPRGPGH